MKQHSRFFSNVTTERKPWTNLNFGGGTDNDDFNFAVVGDRCGRPLQGVFEDAIKKLNQLNPDFIMSIGDFIPGGCMEDMSEEFFRQQWAHFENIIKNCEPPFFRVPGNHDICEDPLPQFPDVPKLTKKLWLEQFGVDYYSFIFKDVLFICLNSMVGTHEIGKEQLTWALDILHSHKDVRWTMIFMHNPQAWLTENFAILEKELYFRNYTVFAGDIHQYTRYRRQGRNYYMLGLTGSASQNPIVPPRGVPFGEFQQIAWVSFKKDIPNVTIFALDGIYYDDVVTIPKLTWLTPKYFQGDKKITKEEADLLESKGLHIHRDIDKYLL